MTVQAVHGGLTRRVPGFDVYVTVAAGSVVGDRPIVKSAPLEILDAGADGLELVAHASLVGLAAAVDPAAGRCGDRQFLARRKTATREVLDVT
ncbi:hypothetical protein [Nocardia fluminea]|uniref:hypothetical protein n=1 Tax=Nocardia fluminea TaxID=134984 RepID=UPI00340C0ABE